MKTFISLCSIVLLAFAGISCEDESLEEELDGRAKDYLFTETSAYGFDDFSSTGACQGIAIDNEGTAIVIGLKFTLPLFTKEFILLPEIKGMITDYQWGEVSTALDDIPELNDYHEVLTNTGGIRTFDYEIVAFMVKYKDGEKQYFIAYNGAIQLTREDGPYDIMEGDLSFVQITEAGPNAKMVNGGEVFTVKNIYFEFSTEVQPD